MQFIHISDLRPNITDKWKITVMVSRAWTSYNPKTNRVFSYDIIVSDDQGGSIHAYIPANLIHVFKNVFKEGRVYRIHNHVPFNLLSDRAHVDKYLTDVIGNLQEWGYVDNQSQFKLNDCDVRNIVLSDECGQKFRVSLWGKVATRLSDADIKSYGNERIVLIITSCKIRRFKGAPSVVTTVGSHVYVNLALPIDACNIYIK
ncbi:hypothetical protein QVD17_07041 [Tagetes erecta]|uniref:Replication protein A OB domain-containing protein n=1 Tax=Tagetes erecta TaxID=13708 RepID=A0AAD8LEQ3_TARER|nr:hypothetical protein QVD17_07041 [Tagetes erecta]